MTNSSGAQTQLLDYDPYGTQRISWFSSTASGVAEAAKTYVGQYHDEETDLSYLNARYYDGARGQFTSQDPTHLAIGASRQIQEITGRSLQKLLADPQLLNSYSYARNNPIIHKDPDGKYLETAFDVAMFWLSLNDFREKPSFWNGVGVLADGTSLLLPIPAIVGGIRHADDATKFLRGVDRAGDVGKVSGKYNWGNPNLLKDHTQRHASDFGLAKDDFSGYAQKANEFITNKQYTHAFKEGKDTVYWNKDTNIAVFTNKNGNISSAYKVTNENKINTYQRRAAKQK